METSSRFGVAHPSADRSDNADIPLYIKNVVDGLETAAMYGQGTLASRPTSSGGSPGIQGRFYTSTDESPRVVYYDYGTGWIAVGTIQDGGVTTVKLADGSVTTVKLADLAVTAAKIADGTITAAKIVDGTITAAKLATALFPSQGAADADEAFRALGFASGKAIGTLQVTSINRKGTLAARPAASAVPAGVQYTATDTNGGTTYLSDGSSTWTQTSTGVTAAPQSHASTHKKSGADRLSFAGSDLASGAALSVTDDVHLVTGSTTITSITASGFTATKGDRLKLIFQATCTVRHNSGGGNIRLSGGLDAGFVANEVLAFLFDGTNWVEETRSSKHLSGQGGIVWNGTQTPTGLLAEDGSAISRATYAAFYNNVGTQYGVGDGSTTVNLPDSRGRVDVGFAASGGHTDVSTIGNNDGVAVLYRRPKHGTTKSLSLSDPGHVHDVGVGNDFGHGGTSKIGPNGAGDSTNWGYVTGDYVRSATTGITLGGSIGTNNANDVQDAPAYLVRPKFTRI